MPDLTNFGMNIYLGIGLAIVLGFLGCVVCALWVGLRAWLWQAAQKRAQAKYLRSSRRADGKTYPPWTGGICDHCKRVRKKIYHPQKGPRLCTDCYERFWREEEAVQVVADGDGAALSHEPQRGSRTQPGVTQRTLGKAASGVAHQP